MATATNGRYSEVLHLRIAATVLARAVERLEGIGTGSHKLKKATVPKSGQSRHIIAS